MDFWVSYLAYFFDINFASTYQIIQKENYVERLIHRIPYTNEDTIKKMNQLCIELKEYIGKKCESAT